MARTPVKPHAGDFANPLVSGLPAVDRPSEQLPVGFAVPMPFGGGMPVVLRGQAGGPQRIAVKEEMERTITSHAFPHGLFG